MLDALADSTPLDHPDREEIPTVRHILASVLKGTQVSMFTVDLIWDLMACSPV